MLTVPTVTVLTAVPVSKDLLKTEQPVKVCENVVTNPLDLLILKCSYVFLMPLGENRPS